MQKSPAHVEVESPFEFLKEGFFIFDGRINRKQFIVRYIFIVVVCTSILMGLEALPKGNLIKGLLQLAIVIAMAWAGFSIYIRRLHDAGMSGWWVLLPFARDIFALFFSGTNGDNKYGKQPDPKIWF